MAQKKANLKKISELTGFSMATISNALHRKPGVNKETAEKILKVAEELGYTNQTASAMESIKFVVFRKDGSILDGSNFHNVVIEGVSQEAESKGMDTIFVQLDPNSPNFEEQVAKLTGDPKVGIILLATEMSTADFEPFKRCECPLVILDGWCDNWKFNSVSIANLDAGGDVGQYLVKMGHKRIGYVGGVTRIRAFQDRHLGFRRAMERAGIVRPPEYHVNVRTKSDLAAVDMKKALTDMEEKGIPVPTAFFVDDDRMAYGVIQALTEKGYRVPEDVSVIGFDDLAFSSLINPPLTTMRVNKQEMGRAAVRRLFDMMHSEDRVGMRTEVYASIVIRLSVADLN